MIHLKMFQDFVKEGVVKRISADKERAKSLINEADRRMNSLDEQLGKIGLKDENANDYIEHCYNIIINLIRAKMFLDGYNASGIGAHESEVSYMRNLGFNENEVQFADQMRYFRNGILYYGTIFDKEYADKVLNFLNKIYPKLKKLLGI